MKMPHYSSAAMPAASLLQAHHVLQWIRTKRFTTYDFMDPATNFAAYQQVRTRWTYMTCNMYAWVATVARKSLEQHTCARPQR